MEDEPTTRESNAGTGPFPSWLSSAPPELVMDDEPVESILYDPSPQPPTPAGIFAPARRLLEELQGGTAGVPVTAVLGRAVEFLETGAPLHVEVFSALLWIGGWAARSTHARGAEGEEEILGSLLRLLWEYGVKAESPKMVLAAGWLYWTWSHQRAKVDRTREVLGSLYRAARSDTRPITKRASLVAGEFEARTDPDRAEGVYAEMVACAPQDFVAWGNYACFMQNVRRNHAEAARLYAQALRLAPDDPANRSNCAGLCLVLDAQREAEQHLHVAWRLAAGRRDGLVARVLFLRAALAALRGESVDRFLGPLKSLLEAGIEADDAPAVTVLLHLQGRLGPELAGLFAVICGVLGGSHRVEALHALPSWQAIPALPVDLPWPDSA